MQIIEKDSLILRIYQADTGETEHFISFGKAEQEMPGFLDNFVKQYDNTPWEVQQIHP